MDLPITTPISKLFETVKVLHLESTTACQAACPLCARETDTTFNKKVINCLTVSQIKQILPDGVINRLNKMFMCGNYGDPAASTETLSIYDYFRDINNSIVLGMNSNGGLQNAKWWTSLAQKFNQPQDYVVFSIDGLQDTNSIYRKNVVWDRVMTNVKSFIEAGGHAHWDMLVYQHNEHQIDACEQLANELGFKWFRAKVSKRSSNISWLKSPKNWVKPSIEAGPINCFRNQEQSLYISAKGTLYPCCWLGHGIETIDKFDQIQARWDTEKCNPICKKTCSTVQNTSNFTGQWQRNIQLC